MKRESMHGDILLSKVVLEMRLHKALELVANNQ